MVFTVTAKGTRRQEGRRLPGSKLVQSRKGDKRDHKARGRRGKIFDTED